MKDRKHEIKGDRRRKGKRIKRWSKGGNDGKDARTILGKLCAHRYYSSR